MTMGNYRNAPYKLHSIVEINFEGISRDNARAMRKNKHRLMRVTKLKKVGKRHCQSGWLVSVKVNSRPLFDLDGNRTLELIGYDSGYFKLHEESTDGEEKQDR
jgi:hypothetical protein